MFRRIARLNLKTYSTGDLIAELKKRGYRQKYIGPYQEMTLEINRYSKAPDGDGKRLKRYEGTVLISPDTRVI